MQRIVLDDSSEEETDSDHLPLRGRFLQLTKDTVPSTDPSSNMDRTDFAGTFIDNSTN
ncbi:hypothetical protein FRX31_024125, partial [Thalictrum thalictroides]